MSKNERKEEEYFSIDADVGACFNSMLFAQSVHVKPSGLIVHRLRLTNLNPKLSIKYIQLNISPNENKSEIVSSSILIIWFLIHIILVIQIINLGLYPLKQS